MIKLGQHIRINIFTVILFTVCIITHRAPLLFIAYFTAFLHESAHCAAAAAIGLRIDNITFYPFGVNLQLKNKVVYSLCDEIILYAAGPALNAVLAICAGFFVGKNAVLDYFYSCNAVMLFVNMLPVLPLDGGIILKKLISLRFGVRAAETLLRAVSGVIVAALIAAECFVAYRAGINYSVVLMIVFLTGNIFTQSEKYNADIIRKLMYGDKKHGGKARVFVMRDDEDLHAAAKNFGRGHYCVIMRVNSMGEITDTVTETQIVKSLTETD